MIIPLGVFRLTPKRCPKMAFPGMIAIDFPHISAHFQGSTKMISICLGVASNSSHNSGVPRIAGDINVHEIHHKDMFKYDSSMSSNFKTYISIIWENYKISRQISYHILQKVAYYTVERRRVTAKSAPSAAWRQIFFFRGGCHIFGQNMLQNVKKSHMVGKKSDPRGGHWASNLRGFMGIGFKAVYKRYARVVVHDQRGPCLLARRSEQQVMPPMRFTYDLFDLFVSQFAREKTTSHILLHWFARMLLRFFWYLVSLTFPDIKTASPAVFAQEVPRRRAQLAVLPPTVSPCLVEATAGAAGRAAPRHVVAAAVAAVAVGVADGVAAWAGRGVTGRGARWVVPSSWWEIIGNGRNGDEENIFSCGEQIPRVGKSWSFVQGDEHVFDPLANVMN